MIWIIISTFSYGILQGKKAPASALEQERFVEQSWLSLLLMDCSMELVALGCFGRRVNLLDRPCGQWCNTMAWTRYNAMVCSGAVMWYDSVETIHGDRVDVYNPRAVRVIAKGFSCTMGSDAIRYDSVALVPCDCDAGGSHVAVPAPREWP